MKTPAGILSAISTHCRDLARSTDGATAVVAGLVFTGLVGFVGLGAETGVWYFTQRSLQAAADSSALSAATALQAGGAGN